MFYPSLKQFAIFVQLSLCGRVKRLSLSAKQRCLPLDCNRFIIVLVAILKTVNMSIDQLLAVEGFCMIT